MHGLVNWTTPHSQTFLAITKHVCRPNSWALSPWRRTGRCRGYSPLPATPTKKPYYVTTPIFYVNAAPHIGHLYSLVLADVLKRWQELRGKKAILCTGTDEHGMKIQKAAKSAGQDVRAFCDENAKQFVTLAAKINASNDHFIRTSEPEHRFAVQHFWLMLSQRGYIYTAKHEGWYSTSDEAFYPASAVQLTLDPSTGRKFMASMETGSEVEWTSETNHHFRLSAFRERLLAFYRANPAFVVPASRMEDVVRAVTAGLEDLSVSRPRERLSWGIPVPDDDTQTIYVWLDALVNYVTKANYPFQIPGQEDAAGWPADCHVVGKDIVRFHCIYWPAFLMALDIEPPKQVLTHAHWTLNRRKMSKSVGNVVNPFFAIDRFGVDALRFYLMLDGGIKDDASYDNQFVVDRYKKWLLGGMGNMVSRITRGKGWSVRDAVVSSCKGVKEWNLEHVEDHRTLLDELPGKVAARFEALDPCAALHDIMRAVSKTNAYISQYQPWDYGHDKPFQESVIYLCAESMRIVAILLQPYMPESMQRMLDMLGVDEDARRLANTVVGSDADFGASKVELGRGRKGVLFEPLSSDG